MPIGVSDSALDVAIGVGDSFQVIWENDDGPDDLTDITGFTAVAHFTTPTAEIDITAAVTDGPGGVLNVSYLDADAVQIPVGQLSTLEVTLTDLTGRRFVIVAPVNGIAVP